MTCSIDTEQQLVSILDIQKLARTPLHAHFYFKYKHKHNAEGNEVCIYYLFQITEPSQKVEEEPEPENKVEKKEVCLFLFFYDHLHYYQ